MNSQILFIIISCLIISLAYAETRRNVRSYQKNHKMKQNLVRKQAIQELNKRACKTTDRYIQPNCKCIDGYYDNGIIDECQVCPYPCLSCKNGVDFCQQCHDNLYISLQHFIASDKLQQLEDYIINEFKLFDDENRLVNNSEPFRPFHGNAVFLHEEKNDANQFDFYNQRKWRGSEFYYQKSSNYNLDKLYKFVNQLDFFEFTGFHFMIFNEPGDHGNLHSDHNFDDLSGEFMWVSPNTAKQFYILPHGIQDKQENRQYVTSNIIWFDDHLRHSIAPSNKRQMTFRIDGKFKPWVRQYILDNYQFQNKNRLQVFKDQQYNLQPCQSNNICQHHNS